MHYLLIYEVSDDYLEKRALYRNEHLKLAWEAHENGELILGGALSEPVDKAILFFKGESPEVAQKFVDKDPYIKNGLVKCWSIRPWNTVVGKDSTSPVMPD
jgi:hypothetical protein